MDSSGLGDRLRAQRGRLYTQRQLAERAGVSVGVVRNLEQGNRNRASLASLHALADALDMSLADLLGPTTIPEQAPDEGALALRHAVNSVHELLPEAAASERFTAQEAQRSLTYVWGTYWSGRYEDVAALLPTWTRRGAHGVRTPRLGTARLAATRLADLPRMFRRGRGTVVR